MQVSLKRVGGAVKIDIDGTAYEPLSFKSFRPTARNISDFYKAGVRLFSILSSGLNSILGVPYSLYGESWIGYDSYDFTPIDRQIELFLQNAPQGYFALMLQLDTRDWYIKKENCPNSFTNLSQIAGDSKWRAQAANYLKAVLNHVEEKYGDRFYGYFLLGGTTTEWFSNRDYFAPHPMKERDYRRFTGCPEAVLPQQAEICRPKETVFYAPDADRNVIDAVRYHCQIIADAILYFASEAQQVLKHRKLVGVYYGYLFELAGARLWNDGSLDYMRVFNSPDIDMISSPSSYAFRKHIDPSAFMVTYDSLNRRDKLYYLEFDHITHLAPQYIEGHGIPGYDSKLKNEQETIDIMRRDFCLTLAKGGDKGRQRAFKLLVHQLFQLTLLGFLFGYEGSHNGILVLDDPTFRETLDDGIGGGLGPVQLFLAQLCQIRTPDGLMLPKNQAETVLTFKNLWCHICTSLV